MVVVTASGDPLLPSFPASLTGVLAVRSAGVQASPVAATAAGVTHGPTLAAPGVDVLTTQPRGGYDFMSGSSLAAAHVSGVAALLLELDPRLDSGTIATLLRRSADYRASTKPGDEISACAALALLWEAERRVRLANLSPPRCGAPG